MVDVATKMRSNLGHYDPTSRTEGGQYDKVRLLAFGRVHSGYRKHSLDAEVLPPGHGRFTAGRVRACWNMRETREVWEWRLGAVIAYRRHFAGIFARSRARASNLFSSSDQDSWFGAETEHRKQMALEVVGSVEMR